MGTTDDQPLPEEEREETSTRAQTFARRATRALLIVMLLAVPIAAYERQWLTALLVLFIIGLSLAPVALGRRFDVRVPAEFELLAVLFIFASLFLGEVHGYYAKFWWWDVVLHTGSGFLLGVVGFLLVYVLNGHESLELHMSPLFVALFACAFAVAMGAVWQIL